MQLYVLITSANEIFGLKINICESVEVDEID